MTEMYARIAMAIYYALSGQKLILRRCGGNFIIAQPPIYNGNIVPTKAQKKVRNRFSAASSYARKALADPTLAEIYKKKATQTLSAFTIAFRDYLKSPEVKSIYTAEYTGKPRSIISIKAKDDVQIKKVEVNILNEEGELIEKGNATIDPILKISWIYTAKKEIEKLQGCKIKAIAKDLAGNTGELIITL